MANKRLFLTLLGALGGAVLAGCGLIRPTETIVVPTQAPSTGSEEGSSNTDDAHSSSAANLDDLEIVTLLPRDAIPSIDNPTFYSVEEANEEYIPEELVLGVVIDGDARAYSTNLLDSHEIVNDVVGGQPIAVTW